MTLKDFIKENKEELDIAIYRAMGVWEQGTANSNNGYRLNNKERQEWLLNDESLYRWARMYGVRL